MPTPKNSISCECSPIYEAEFDPDEEEPIVAVAQAIATIKGIDPLELPPLYEEFNVEALDELFKRRDEESEEKYVLSFSVENWNIFIQTNGSLRICDTNNPSATASPFQKGISD